MRWNIQYSMASMPVGSNVQASQGATTLQHTNHKYSIWLDIFLRQSVYETCQSCGAKGHGIIYSCYFRIFLGFYLGCQLELLNVFSHVVRPKGERRNQPSHNINPEPYCRQRSVSYTLANPGFLVTHKKFLPVASKSHTQFLLSKSRDNNVKLIVLDGTEREARSRSR